MWTAHSELMLGGADSVVSTLWSGTLPTTLLMDANLMHMMGVHVRNALLENWEMWLYRKVRLYTLSRDWSTNTRWPEAKTMSVKCLAGAKLDMLASSSFCWHLLTKKQICWHLLTLADNCWQLLTRKILSSTKSTCVLTFADTCWQLLTCADVWWYLLTFAEPCRLKRCNNFPKGL